NSCRPRFRSRPAWPPRSRRRSPEVRGRTAACWARLPRSIRDRAPPRRSMALREPLARPYRLRPPGPFDLDEIARIEAESFPVPWKREFFASELVEPHRYLRVLVAEGDGEPRIGGYLFAVSLYEEFHINKIATDVRLRRRGFGRQLFEDALARARAAGSTAI